MEDNSFKLTREFIKKNPGVIRDMGFFISNDPTTGKKAAHEIFVTGEKIWVIDHLLVSSYFKRTYLVENILSNERCVLGITKSPVPRKTPELSLADRLKEYRIPYIVEILDVFNINTGQKGIMYRYYNGGDLHRRIKQGDLTDVDRKIIADCLIKAVAGLHSHGIFHRDIKPANVLLEIDEAIIGAYLSDFGEATSVDNPQSIRNIEHQHSAPEGNALMEKHKKPLRDWYDVERERKHYEEKGIAITEEFKQKEFVVEEGVQPLMKEIKEVTTSSTYDSWGLGITLWCVFANQINEAFSWREAAHQVNYGQIAALKQQFIESNPAKDFPKPYNKIVAGLLKYDYTKRLTAEQALTLLE